MFTVKHVEDNGHESVVLAKVVNFFPLGEGVVNDPMVIAYECVALAGLDTTNRYGSGEVFVMNEMGKTVSRYRLKHSDA